MDQYRTNRYLQRSTPSGRVKECESNRPLVQPLQPMLQERCAPQAVFPAQMFRE